VPATDPGEEVEADQEVDFIVPIDPAGTGSSPIGRALIDSFLDDAPRSFAVPLVLVLAFGGYLVAQRVVGRGRLPMSGEDLPSTVTTSAGVEDDVRYRL
jgi:hypothetical protein